MANDENDMTGSAAATAGETASIKRARQRALEGDAPPTAEQIARGVAEAMARLGAKPMEEKPLGSVVRASVRVGTETVRQVNSDGSTRLVTRPKSVTFAATETADGREYTVQDGRPIRLTRDAFIARRDMGHVQRAE